MTTLVDASFAALGVTGVAGFLASAVFGWQLFQEHREYRTAHAADDVSAAGTQLDVATFARAVAARVGRQEIAAQVESAVRSTAADLHADVVPRQSRTAS